MGAERLSGLTVSDNSSSPGVPAKHLPLVIRKNTKPDCIFAWTDEHTDGTGRGGCVQSVTDNAWTTPTFPGPQPVKRRGTLGSCFECFELGHIEVVGQFEVLVGHEWADNPPDVIVRRGKTAFGARSLNV